MSQPRSRILIVDDSPTGLTLLAEALEPAGYEVLTASTGHDALRIAEQALPDLIMLDVVMPGHDGYSVCRMLKREDVTRDIPVIFITSKDDTAGIVEGFRVGAVDYLHKPFRAPEVVTRVATHLRISQLTRELQTRNAELEAEMRQRQKAERLRERADHRLSSLADREAERWGLDSLVGESKHLRRVVSDITRLHRFERTSVLITGESGTGKELVARAIHHQSPRAGGPFVAINCVAIPEALAESTFFGHVKGAFTGAATERKGAFELADGGTLFLDEIGDMPATLQAKLLRVLEDSEVTPVGAGSPIKVDVRVVSATNATLEEKVSAGEFRADLYYRLARYVVETPPLRERPEDLPLLAEHFLRLFANEMGAAPPALDCDALALLQSHSFPGNIRELKNTLERALILSGGKTIRRDHLVLTGGSTAPESGGEAIASKAVAEDEIPMPLEEAERFLIRRALRVTGGNVAEAARLLQVNRSRIYRRMPGEA
ncbi:MAG: sigma-54 dependent transcriptional regulator [Verrucomicrobiales bacterium]|nr:sigma-54 dependent transcriptional regulator [Verrucomicrobiales bacterium]